MISMMIEVHHPAVPVSCSFFLLSLLELAVTSKYPEKLLIMNLKVTLGATRVLC